MADEDNKKSVSDSVDDYKNRIKSGANKAKNTASDAANAARKAHKRHKKRKQAKKNAEKATQKAVKGAAKAVKVQVKAKKAAKNAKTAVQTTVKILQNPFLFVGLALCIVIFFVVVYRANSQVTGGSMYSTATTEGNEDVDKLGIDVIAEQRVLKAYDDFYENIHSQPDFCHIGFKHDKSNFLDLCIIYETVATGMDGVTSTFNTELQDGEKATIYKPDDYSEKDMKALKYEKLTDPAGGDYYVTSNDVKKRCFDMIFNRMMTYTKSPHCVINKKQYYKYTVNNMTAEEYIKKYPLTETQQAQYDLLVDLEATQKSKIKNLDSYDATAMDDKYSSDENINFAGVDAGTFSGSNAAKLFKVLRMEGLSKAGAAGIIGNFKTESNLNPNARGCNNAYGLAQWDPKGNPKTYKKLMSLKNHDTIEVQATFFLKNFKGHYKASNGEELYKFLCHVDDPGVACSEFQWHYERGAYGDRPKGHLGPNAKKVYYHGNLKRNLVTHGLNPFFKQNPPSKIGQKVKKSQANYDAHRKKWVIAYYQRFFHSWNYYNDFKDLSMKQIEAEAEGGGDGARKDVPADKVGAAVVSWCKQRTSKQGWRYSKKYRYGKKSVDCSSYAWRAYYANGITLCNKAYSSAAGEWSELKKSCKISGKELAPGDLIFNPSEGKAVGHVSIYIGKGRVIAAHGHSCHPQVGEGSMPKHIVGYARPSKLKAKKKKK